MCILVGPGGPKAMCGRSVRAGRQGGERIFQEQTEFIAYIIYSCQ